MSDSYSGNIYTSVGLMGGTLTDPETGKECECVGLEFPTGIGEEVETKLITLAAAKNLVNDLKDAIDACLEHMGNNRK